LINYSEKMETQMEVKLTGKSQEQRIADRLKSSCGDDSDIYTTQGDGPQRVHTAIHLSGSAKQYGKPNPGEGSIDGRKRDVV
jgi:hypothetical protein